VFLADLGPLGAQPGPGQMNNQQGICLMIGHDLYYLCFLVFLEVLEYIVFSFKLYPVISITTISSCSCTMFDKFGADLPCCSSCRRKEPVIIT
jgi:hypothetical protein